MLIDFIEKIDIQLFYVINQAGRNAFFDVFMPIMSDVTLFYIPMGLALAFLLIRNNAKFRVVAVFVLLVISSSENLSSAVLKPIFARPRPYHSVSEVHLYDRMGKTWSVTPPLAKVVRGESHSLPSSHATNIFAGAFFLSFFFRKLAPFFYLIAFLVGYSRVYLGVHFPFDVVAGAVAGTSCGMVYAWPAQSLIAFFRRKFAEKGSGPKLESGGGQG